MGSASAGIGSALPDQTGATAGSLLTTDGTVASWEVSSATLPSQGGNSGKFLTTNGTAASWASVSGALPTQTGNDGKFLTTNGTTAAWSDLVGASLSAPTTSGLTIAGNVTTGSSAIGVVIDNLVALTTAGAKIASFQNHEAEKLYVDKDGGLHTDVGLYGVTTGQTNFAVGSVGGYANLWLGANADTPAIAGAALTDVAGSTYLNTPGTVLAFSHTGTPLIQMVSASGNLTLIYGALELSGVGKGVKFTSPDGNTTKTLTIDNAGAAVWT